MYEFIKSIQSDLPWEKQYGERKDGSKNVKQSEVFV